jgi:hypothetical protein
MPGPVAAGSTGHVPAPLTGPARTNLMVRDLLGRSVLLRDCLDRDLTPFPAGVQLSSVAAVALPWYGLLAGHGGQSPQS